MRATLKVGRSAARARRGHPPEEQDRSRTAMFLDADGRQGALRGSPTRSCARRTCCRSALGEDYVVALNLLSRNPHWLAAIGALPMYLGLDLRGGVHFLLQVDMKGALAKKHGSVRERHPQRRCATSASSTAGVTREGLSGDRALPRRGDARQGARRARTHVPGSRVARAGRRGRIRASARRSSPKRRRARRISRSSRTSPRCATA